MTELPAEITLGKVIGRFRLAAHDTADAGSNPDAVPDSGRIRFVATTPYRRVLLPEPETVGTFSGVFDLDTDGYLIDSQGNQGVWVPTGTYTVDFLLKKLRIASRVIEVTAEHTELAPLDLAIVIPPTDAEISPSQYGELSERLELVEAAAEHGGLPGLLDDDHPQYALADGSRGSFATVAQGAKADTAVQPAALAAHEADTTSVHGIADTSALVTTTDPRLSDARTPLAHTQAASTITDLTETVQDIVGAFIVGGTNVTVSYNDAANTFTINATASGGGETDPEIVRDVIGAALVAGSGIQITVNDAGDTITIASTAVLPTRQVNSGTGLTGGGDLSANRTLAVNFDVVATAAQGEKADAAIPSGLVDAKGDLIVATADNTVTRLPASTDGYVLTLDSAESVGVKWAAPVGGGGSSLPDPGFLVKDGGAISDNTYAPGWAMENAWGFLTLPWQWIYWVPYYISHERVLHGLSFTTTAAGVNAYLGLYTADLNWQPDTRLFGSSELDVSSSATYNINDLALTLPPGRYLAALQSSSGNLTVRAPASARATFLVESAGVNPVGATYRQLKRNVAYVPFPASGSSIRWGGGGDHPGQDGLPYIFMRFNA